MKLALNWFVYNVYNVLSVLTAESTSKSAVFLHPVWVLVAKVVFPVLLAVRFIFFVISAHFS